MSTPPLRAALLQPLYRHALREWPLLGTPVAVAARFEETPPDADAGARLLAGYYTSLCGATGFVCGVPGALALPLTLPANLAGVALLQLHMCAAIATLGGHDMHAAGVREIAVRCLLDDSSAPRERDEAEGVLRRLGGKLAERGVRLLGERALTHGAAGGVVQGVGRRMPLVGGVVGGVTDALSTGRVARNARRAFLSAAPEPGDGGADDGAASDGTASAGEAGRDS